ncbi:MAG: serine/threonine protein kinase, partial [Polyangiales bacterium]
MVDSDPKLAPGTVVLGRIRVEAALSVSGIGALHRGRTTSSSAPLLVRVMSSRLLMRATDAFAREMLVMRHLEHAGIVAPLDAGVEGRRAFVVYESVEGPTAHPGSEKMSLAEVARVTSEVAHLLDHAHRQPSPVIHAALSTSSVVLVGDERSVRLLDLGIVQALERVGVLPGSLFDLLHPASASPEQVSGTFPASAATDVFGLASLAFEWLTGQVAFPATNAAEADALIVSGKRPSVHDARSEVSSEVDRLLAKAWSVDPRSRPHDVLTFARELGALLLRPISPALLAAPTTPGAVIQFDDEAVAVEVPTKPEHEEPTVRGQRPKAERAMTLPFGLPTPVSPSDFPPPGDKTTVPKIVAAKAPGFDLTSDPPPPAEPAPAPAPAV